MAKNKSIYELDPEKLSTTDEHGNRVYIYAEAVKGYWQRRRDIFYWFLIVLYLALPWINVSGKPALQVDIFHRRFTFFGGTIDGVEPILMFLAIISGLFLIAFMTSIFGRVWCGWACPQTVFIQSIFMKIEEFIEGSPKRRRELDAAKWNFQKILKRGTKWFIFTVISLHIAHTFIGYVVGPRELLAITTQTPSENWGLFIGTMILSAIFLVDFGWFREQFCIIMCPYGRIQSVMMDDNSLVVAYDKNRGEPHFGLVPKGEEGDCVNCYHCVKVCPVGIDIRHGTQLECIHCTKCIDACDNIMDRLERPRGLIKYAADNGEKHKIFTPRAMIYLGVSLTLIGLLLFALKSSANLNLVFLRSKVPFTVTQDQQIMNNFQLKITHQGNEKRNIFFKIKEQDMAEKVRLITPANPMHVDQPEKRAVFIFRFDQEVLKQGNSKITVQIEDVDTKEIIAEKEVSLVGPSN